MHGVSWKLQVVCVLCMETTHLGPCAAATAATITELPDVHLKLVPCRTVPRLLHHPGEQRDSRSCKCGKSDEVKKVGTISGIICLSTAQT